MTRFSPFEASLWHATAHPAPDTRPLTGETEADVCIVGAGYAGLTTALELAKAGQRVVVLERAEAGFGGSARNAGHCTPTFTHYGLDDLRRMLGAPWAERLIRRQTRANDVAARLIRDHRIDCDWVQRGYVMGALRPNQLPALEAEAQSYNAAGARTRVLDRAEVQAITGSPRFYGGWLHEEAGHLHPLNYARGLARAVLESGGRLHTGSEVTGCTVEGARWLVQTPQGKVRAGKVIFTTGAYTVGGWPGLDQSFRIQRVFVAATQVLPLETRRILLPQNTTLHDGRGDIFVYKWDAEGRIVASMFPMGRRGRDLSHTRQILTDRLRWLHPGLGPIDWPQLWFGELDTQRRTVPRLYGLAQGVVALTGLSGRGGILADWAQGRPEADLDLRLEPLHHAPLWMADAPALRRVPSPPHA